MKASLFVVASALVWGVASAAAETAAVPFRELSFADASKAAAAEGKLVFIDFYTTWCAPCKELDKTTWTDPAVAKLLAEKAVPLKIDAEKQVDLARQYKINAYPTLLLLKADGTEIDRIVGYRPADKFIAEFTAGAAGKNAVQRAKEAVAANGENNPTERMKLGREYARAGNDAAALQEFLWCYDEGAQHQPSFANVRGSFLVGELGTLAQRYTPAHDALLERREAAMQAMMASTDDFRPTIEFAALNRALRDEARTLGAYEQLAEDDPRRRLLARSVFDILLKERRYAEAATAMPFNEMMAQVVQIQASMLRLASRPEGAKMIDTIRQSGVRTAAKHVEALAGAGQLDAARELARKVFELDESTQAIEILSQAAAQAGQPDLLAAKVEPAAK